MEINGMTEAKKENDVWRVFAFLLTPNKCGNLKTRIHTFSSIMAVTVSIYLQFAQPNRQVTGSVFGFYFRVQRRIKKLFYVTG